MADGVRKGAPIFVFGAKTPETSDLKPEWLVYDYDVIQKSYMNK